MAIFRCKACGAQLEVKPGQNVATCEYCGSIQTLPDTDDEKKISLYNRARLLRYRNDFDKAIAAYQAIVSAYPDDAEAHWGLCIAKYGIEYVDDPRTGDKVPTCHRTLYESILEDPDYLEAIEKADVVSRDLYSAEAKEIDRLQKRIIKISQKEEPYDIFICYKETDDTGQRTQDSVFAQDIYDKLVEKDYKVFFARITLENKLGLEYEPIIFAALRSAKVMLVVGTKNEYFEAVWVKNEWSRFLSFMRDDKDKYLIPCYKGMDAYDMPDEFQPLQSQDMSKIGYIQDLTRGIDKIFGKDQKKVVVQAAPVVGGKLSSFYTRVEMNLASHEFEKADWLIESIFTMDENDAHGYLYRYMVKEKISTLRALKETEKELMGDRDFATAYNNADPEFKKQLDEYVSNAKYNLALHHMRDAQYDYAKTLFEALGSFLDSEKKALECVKLKDKSIVEKGVSFERNNQYSNALSVYETIFDEKLRNERIEACQEAKAKYERMLEEERQRVEHENEIKNKYYALKKDDRALVQTIRDNKLKLLKAKENNVLLASKNQKHTILMIFAIVCLVLILVSLVMAILSLVVNLSESEGFGPFIVGIVFTSIAFIFKLIQMLLSLRNDSVPPKYAIVTTIFTGIAAFTVFITLLVMRLGETYYYLNFIFAWLNVLFIWLSLFLSSGVIAFAFVHEKLTFKYRSGKISRSKENTGDIQRQVDDDIKKLSDCRAEIKQLIKDNEFLIPIENAENQKKNNPTKSTKPYRSSSYSSSSSYSAPSYGPVRAFNNLSKVFTTIASLFFLIGAFTTIGRTTSGWTIFIIIFAIAWMIVGFSSFAARSPGLRITHSVVFTLFTFINIGVVAASGAVAPIILGVFAMIMGIAALPMGILYSVFYRKYYG